MKHNTLTYGERLQDLFLNKPEQVVDFPEWLLSPRTVESYRSIPRLAVVEIAGRDSVAAAVKSAQEKSFTDLVPTYVYTGTEYGQWNSVNQAVQRLAECLPNVHVHNLIVMGSPRFWKALNGALISELISRYGFYTPCVGCHLYLHALRIPLALLLGKIPIISGERERHNGHIKINQVAEALDIYKEPVERFGVRLLFPLRKVVQGKEIEALLKMPWQQEKEQLHCCLSGNYRSIDGSTGPDKAQIVRYLNEFALPCTLKIVKKYVSGQTPNHLKIAKHIIQNL
jgi:hypothetical protein